MDHQKSPIKAGIGYTIGNYLLKGLSFLTLPLFSRLLSTSDFGIYNTFLAYESILFVIVGLAIHSSYKNARYKYKLLSEGAEKGRDYQSYISSTMILLILNFIFLLIMINCLSFFLQKTLKLNPIQQNLLVFYAFSSAVITCYNSYVGIDYKYKSFLKVAAINSISNILLSITLILTLFNTERYIGRIIGTVIPSFIIALIIIIYFLRLSKPSNTTFFLKWGVKYSLPIVPHGLSQIILSSFDRIMILYMVNAASAGIYSFAYSVCAIVNVTVVSLDSVWSPWFYEKKKQNRDDLIRKYASIYALLIFFYCIIIILIAPELLKILGPIDYSESVYCVIPLVTGSFFTFLYNFPANIEYYYEKTKFIAIGTMCAAIINIGLNVLFIKRFGYIAASYTTLGTYILYFIFHYLLARKIEKKSLFNNKIIISLCIGIIVMCIIGISLLNYPLIRWIISLLFIFGLLSVEERKIGFLKKYLKKIIQ